MTKRNFILLIIILVIALIAVFGLFYLQKPKNTTTDTGGTNFGFDFNPFGSKTTKPTSNNGTTPTDVSGYILPTNTENQIKQMTKVSTIPVAGYGIFMKERFKALPIGTTDSVGSPQTNTNTPAPITTPTSKTNTTQTKPTAPLTEFMPAIRYVARETGYIYQTFADKIEERQFSNTIIPKVYEAFFGNTGESVIMRYLKTDNKTIITFLGSLPKEYLGSDTSNNNEIKGSFLPENITDLNISSDSSQIFYIVDSGNSVSGISADVIGVKKAQIFDSPFTEWLSLWPNSKLITLNTKPSGLVPGYVYGLDTNKKELNKILGGIKGLNTLMSPNEKLILYGDNNLSLNTYNLDTRETQRLGVNTIPEKCVWGKVGDMLYCSVPKYINPVLYPDAWYKGEISFSDEIWKIDLTTGNTTKIIDPISVVGGEEIDGIKLSLDEGENYLFFINKKDSYLWKLDLK